MIFEVGLYLTSGQVIKFKAKTFSCKYEGSRVTSCNWTAVGPEEELPLFADLAAIRAITQRLIVKGDEG